MNELILENIADAVEKNVTGNEAMLEAAKTFVVSNAEQYEAASVFIKAIKEMVDERKAYFEPRKKTAKQVHTDWCNAEKEACADLEKAESVVKGKMAAWYRAEQERKDAERKALEEAAKKDGVDPSMVQPAQEQKIAGASQREIWRYEVTDFKALPDSYKVPNEQLLSAEAKKKEAASVPGVRFYRDYTTVNR